MTKTAHTKLDFIALSGGGRIGTLLLNRPESANAFSAQMMEEITEHFSSLSKLNDVRALVVTGEGKHFSAGADLNWMQSAAKLSFEENISDAEKLRAMFEAIVNLQIPKIAAIKGAVYGGAVGLVACCDFAIAHEQARFCLSEAKLGLLPAVISPYLMRKMRPGQLRRLSLTATVFSANEAKEYGLVEVVASDLEQSLNSELGNILACGPEAQQAINKLFNHLRENGADQCDDTVQAIAKARTGNEGQAGLNSFFTKTTSPWLRTIS